MDKFDFTDGDFHHNMGGGMAMDLESGEMHITDCGSSSILNDDEDDW